MYLFTTITSLALASGVAATAIPAPKSHPHTCRVEGHKRGGKAACVCPKSKCKSKRGYGIKYAEPIMGVYAPCKLKALCGYCFCGRDNAVYCKYEGKDKPDDELTQRCLRMSKPGDLGVLCWPHEPCSDPLFDD